MSPAAASASGTPAGADHASPRAASADPTHNAALLRLKAVPGYVWDGMLATAATAVAMYVVLGGQSSASGYHTLDAIGIALVLLTTLPLALTRLDPFAVLVTIMAATIVTAAMDYGFAPGILTAIVPLFATTTLCSHWRGLLAGLVASIGLLAGFGFAVSRHDVSWAVGIGMWATYSLVWIAGTGFKVYRDSALAAAEQTRIERERAELFLHDLEMHASEAVGLERSRLARELHDVVGHSLNVVVLQAGAARRVFDSKPEAVREALTAIESASRDALADIERMLGILRAEESDAESLDAQPGFGSVARLVEQVREAGLPVDLQIDASVRELPQSIDLSAYRIVQEALTNSLKHAGRGARATVTAQDCDDVLCLEIVDDGGGAAPSVADTAAGAAAAAQQAILSGGRGLLGMRERVLLFGGRLEVGPRPEGGFRVYACLPLRGAHL